MRHLWPILRLMWRDQRSALLRGAGLSAVVLAMGAALLGLSGWFITAAAAAGLAGAGASFDVFRPSALVRFLALGRAAARYGERVLTHDATLRALESLRLRVLEAHLAAPHDRMLRIRGAQALNRLTADIDALDSLPLRLALPVLAGAGVLLLALAVLWWLVGPMLALWITLGYALGVLGVAQSAVRRMLPLSRRAEMAAQAFRARLIDMIRARGDLAVYGQLQAQLQAVKSAEERRFALRTALNRTERGAGLALSLLATFVASGALALGLSAAEDGAVEPALAAMAFFAALALAEVLAPLRRGLSDLGRMADAARRIGRDLTVVPVTTGPDPHGSGDLVVQGLRLTRPGGGTLVDGLSLTLRPGETVALTGPSGSGKSTLLLALAGLHPVAAGQVILGGLALDAWPETALRGVLTLLPQRSVLMAGSVAEALMLAGPAAEAELWAALRAVHLDKVIAQRGGLSTRIGPRGTGLSGGEARRLVLARALLRRPKVLLLDEPTEGLDDPTARAVLAGIRAFLPEAAILIAAHRPAEIDAASRIITLQ
ncbi:amino acid ABC transporter ATP-binding/permease protein [Tabrizicola thermarum]|uniref:amino acid ABC transporter ATP-binding/permease protein n=1 Tax=Tabrizicola thermarum TaxID=2670345 RepID=UPI000FFBA84C|nr:ATP-binding cassette domain-containing protein [Tabrizicola thermarum]